MKSERPETTKMLSLSLERHINPNNDTRIYMAKEVTFDYATGHSVRVDYMQFKPVNNSVSGIEKGDFYCYEIKSSAEDFHSKNGHNFIGDFNYYVMPEEMFDAVKAEIPHDVGVYVPDCMHSSGRWYCLKSVKKAWRKDRIRPESEMLLMMFRSAAREILKIESLKDRSRDNDEMRPEDYCEWERNSAFPEQIDNPHAPGSEFICTTEFCKQCGKRIRIVERRGNKMTPTGRKIEEIIEAKINENSLDGFDCLTGDCLTDSDIISILEECANRGFPIRKTDLKTYGINI